MKRAVAIAVAGLLLPLGAGAWLAMADQATVTGTAHDLGSPGAGGVSSCETCHVPHEAAGEVLWEDSEPRAEGTLAGIASDCYSCHDGTVAGGAYVFNEDSVRHPLDRAAGQDCDTCHDPHLSDYGSFLLFPSGANLCQACHESAGGANHPVNVSIDEAGFSPLDTDWSPDEGDFHGTRLWDPSGRPGTEYLKCLSCHAAHGGSPGTLLATRDTAGTGRAFCQNCHNSRAVP